MLNRDASSATTAAAGGASEPLARPTVAWTALHGQFGAGFKAVRQLKPTFRDALGLALVVFPEARVDLDQPGVILLPLPPVVPQA